jgi:hypothetical protein
MEVDVLALIALLQQSILVLVPPVDESAARMFGENLKERQMRIGL